MLFSTKLESINSAVTSTKNEIEQLEQKIEQLREEKLNLENHAQQVLSAQSAAESAISQVRTALAMVRASAPDSVDTFKSAIDELFNFQDLLEDDPLNPVTEAEAVEAEAVEAEVVEAEAVEDEVVEDDEDGKQVRRLVQIATFPTRHFQQINDEPSLTVTELCSRYKVKELKTLALYLKIKPLFNRKQEWAEAIASHNLPLSEAEKVFKVG